MTAREKTLAKIAVPVMGLGLLYALGSRVVAAPFVDAAKELRRLEDELQDKQQKKSFAEKHLDRYRDLCAMIPAADSDTPGATKTATDRTGEYLNKKINELLELTEFTERSVKPDVKTRKTGKGKKKKKIEVVTYTVTGSGDFKEVLEFLLEIYKMGDLLYVSSVDLKPDRREYSKRVNATIKIQTPVIPRDEEILKSIAEPEAKPDLDVPDGKTDEDGGHREEHMGRLAGVTMAYYDPLLDWRVFDPIRPDPPPENQTLEKPQRPGRREQDPIVESDSERDNLIVRGFMNDSVLVVTRGARSRRLRGSRDDDEREFFNIGQDFDGGVLEFVHRLGVVVSRKEQQGDPSELFVYQYGQPFSDSMLMDTLISERGEFRQIRRAFEAAKEAQEGDYGPFEDGSESPAHSEEESTDESESGD